MPMFSDTTVGMGHAGSRIVETGVADCDVVPEAFLDLHDLMKCCSVSTSSAVIRRHLFAEVGGFDETLAEAEDWDMWIRIAAAGYKVADSRKCSWNIRFTLATIAG